MKKTIIEALQENMSIFYEQIKNRPSDHNSYGEGYDEGVLEGYLRAITIINEFEDEA